MSDSPMAGITEFTEARLAEDEATARAAIAATGNDEQGGHWYVTDYDGNIGAKGQNGLVAVGQRGSGLGPEGAHIARHDPARVLRETAVLRTFLRDHQPTRPWGDYGLTYPEAAGYCADCGPGDSWQVRGEPENWEYARWPCGRVRELASIWSDNPGYDQAWAPVPDPEEAA